jgi:hypothetical protein
MSWIFSTHGVVKSRTQYEGKRPLGRPRRGRLADIKMQFEGTGLNGVKWDRVVRDMACWQSDHCLPSLSRRPRLRAVGSSLLSAPSSGGDQVTALNECNLKCSGGSCTQTVEETSICLHFCVRASQFKR